MGVPISKPMIYFELEKLKSALEKNSIQDVSKQINEEFNLLNSTTLDIAITGMSGAGKSSLVNALRGMDDFEEGAAETGITETTMETKKYPHPIFPKVTIWDLPGSGTPKFLAKEYLERTNLAEYDFFIIVAAERFTEHDVLLAKEIQKMKKKYYFVRSKVDQSIEADKRKMKSHFNEEETLETIREYCCENLRKAGESNPRVFLLSSWEPSAYDFPLLQDTLENDLDGLKRQVIIESMPAYSNKLLEKKRAAMEDLIWKVTLVACAVGAIPVPGLSLVCDIRILVTTMQIFYKVFGLDEQSLGILSKRVGIPIDELKSAIKTSPSKINEKFVKNLVTDSDESWIWMVVKFVLMLIPVLGSLLGGAFSYVTISSILKRFLNDVMEDAENVWAKATEFHAKRSAKTPI